MRKLHYVRPLFKPIIWTFGPKLFHGYNALFWLDCRVPTVLPLTARERHQVIVSSKTLSIEGCKTINIRLSHRNLRYIMLCLFRIDFEVQNNEGSSWGG